MRHPALAVGALLLLTFVPSTAVADHVWREKWSNSATACDYTLVLAQCATGTFETETISCASSAVSPWTCTVTFRVTLSTSGSSACGEITTSNLAARTCQTGLGSARDEDSGSKTYYSVNYAFGARVEERFTVCAQAYLVGNQKCVGGTLVFYLPRGHSTGQVNLPAECTDVTFLLQSPIDYAHHCNGFPYSEEDLMRDASATLDMADAQIAGLLP